MRDRTEPIETTDAFEAFVIARAASLYPKKFLLRRAFYGEKEFYLEIRGTSRRSDRVAIPTEIGEALSALWKKSATEFGDGSYVGALSPIGLAKRYDEAMAKSPACRLAPRAKTAKKEAEAEDRGRKHDVPISGAAYSIRKLVAAGIGGSSLSPERIEDAEAREAVEALIAKAEEVYAVLRTRTIVHEIEPLYEEK